MGRTELWVIVVVVVSSGLAAGWLLWGRLRKRGVAQDQSAPVTPLFSRMSRAQRLAMLRRYRDKLNIRR